MGVTPNSWMVYSGNPNLKWMITRGTPMTLETSICSPCPVAPKSPESDAPTAI